MNNQRSKKVNVRIMLLEDESVIAKLYQKKLSEAGFEVTLFTTTDELLKSYKKINPDIAFLDHALHGENQSGLDVIPILKEFNPSVKIIVLSNYSKFQMEHDAKKAGADDYLLKINHPPHSLVEYTKKLLS